VVTPSLPSYHTHSWSSRSKANPGGSKTLVRRWIILRKTIANTLARTHYALLY
jgi:hypothetical protein